MRILLDHNLPIGLKVLLVGHDVSTAFEMGWQALANGKLLAAAESAGFDALLTADQNIRHQNDLSAFTLAVLVLSTNNWPVIRASADRVREAADGAEEGRYVLITLPRPKLIRRPPPRGSS